MKNILILLLVFITLASCTKPLNSLRKPASTNATLAYVSTSGNLATVSETTNEIQVPLNTEFVLEPKEKSTLYTYQVTGLDSDFSYNKKSGQMKGTPKNEKTLEIVVSILNGKSVVDKANYKLKCIKDIVPTILKYPNTLGLQKNTLYNFLPTESNGNWLTYSASNLPDGFTIDKNTGKISGTYTGAGGTYTATITVSNSSGALNVNVVFSFLCETSFTNVNGSCVESTQTRSCQNQPENSNGGSQISNDGGVNWSACQGFTCSNNYLNVNGVCTLLNQTRTCVNQPANSSGGTESTSNAGVSWLPCSGFSCNPLFTSINGSCVSTNQTRSCTTQPANSIGGTEASSNAGVSWAACSGFSCLPNYSNVGGACVLSNQTRACLTQPSHSSGGVESTSNGGANWSSCAGFTCSTGYSLLGTSCNINSYTLTLTKPANQGSVSDLTLSQIIATAADTSISKSYTYGQMIVFEATPLNGFAITGWNGCDAISTDFKRCTINSLGASKTITPIFQATSQALTVSLSDTTLANYAPISVYKNGVICAGSCLSSLILTDLVKVSIAVDTTKASNISSFSMTGNYSSLNTSNVNEVSFVMGTSNVSIIANLIKNKTVPVLKDLNIDFSLANSTLPIVLSSSTDPSITWTYTIVSNPTNGTLSGSSNTRTYSINNWTVCSQEYQTCNFTGTQYVKYGTATHYVIKQLTNGTPCSNSVFTDPAYGIVKTCWILPSSDSFTYKVNDGSSDSNTAMVTINYKNALNLTQSCNITNGQGSQVSSDGGYTWGSCTAISCNPTYSVVNNQCVAMAQSRTCSNSMGSGTQSSADGGLTWGDCIVLTGLPTMEQTYNLTDSDDIIYINEGYNTMVYGNGGVNTAVFPDYAQYFTYTISQGTVYLHFSNKTYVLNSFQYIQFGDKGFQVLNGSLVSVSATPATMNVNLSSTYVFNLSSQITMTGLPVMEKTYNLKDTDDTIYINESYNTSVNGGAGINTAVFPDYAQYFTYVISQNNVYLKFSNKTYVLTNFQYIQFGDKGYQIQNGELVYVQATPASYSVAKLAAYDFNLVGTMTVTGLPVMEKTYSLTDADDIIYIDESYNTSVNGGGGVNTAAFPDYAQYFTYIINPQNNTVYLKFSNKTYVLTNFQYIQFGDKAYQIQNGALISISASPASNTLTASYNFGLSKNMVMTGLPAMEKTFTQNDCDDIVYINESFNTLVDGAGGINTAVFPDYVQYFTYVVNQNTSTIYLKFSNKTYVLKNFQYIKFGDKSYQFQNGTLNVVSSTPAARSL